MKCWLNIHDPAPISEDPNTYHAKLWLQNKHRNTALIEVQRGDIGVIYETEGPRRRIVEDVNRQNRRIVNLRPGSKGIFFVIKIKADFQWREHLWDGIHFIGYFGGEKVNTKRNLIPLKELRETWGRAGLPSFNPYINGGLRKLKPEEWQIISDLIGYR